MPILETPPDDDAVRLLTLVLPLLAAWEPVIFASECLEETAKFLLRGDIWAATVCKIEHQGRNIEALGVIVRETSTAALPWFEPIFAFVKRNLVERRKWVDTVRV